MGTGRYAPIFARLSPDVRAAAPSHGDAFSLADELTNLDRVRRVRAAEATVFYCARVLEALAAAALGALKLRPSANVFANLGLIDQLGLMPKVTGYWAHALRRTGNAVRHLHRRVGPADADLSLAFAESWMDWYFCRYPAGPRAAGLTADGQPLWPTVAAEVRAWKDALDPSAMDAGGLLAFWRDRAAAGRPVPPVFAAALAEELLDRGHEPAARAVLADALTHHSDDLRLGQLEGLCHSRAKTLDLARERLERLRARYPDDEETAGILAGVYKRMWQADPAAGRRLADSHRLYLGGWKSSKQANTYLGINAAATALLSGRPADSRKAAATVADVLGERLAILARAAPGAGVGLTLWDRATLAEARLLAGRWADARRTYRETFARDPEMVAAIGVTKNQLGLLLGAFGVAPDPDAFLAHPPPGPDAPLRVGVTGHRSLPADPDLRARVRDVLADLLARHPGRRLVLVSPLAEGADRLAAEVALELGGSLEVILPLELDDYRKDFATAESRQQFADLLARADVVEFPPGPAEGRTAAYERCGHAVVDRGDVVLALWDGRPPAGRGGTAEIVQYARGQGKPVAWVETAPPFAVRYDPAAK